LRAIAHDVLIDARLAVEKSGSSGTAAVHEFRRQMKCWRALLRLLEPFVGEDAHQLRVTARDLARDLGAARDPQSAREAFDDLTEHGLPLSDRAIKSVRRCIDDLRAKGESHALGPKMRRRIDETLTEASDALDRWPLHVLTFPDLAKQLAAGYRDARRAVPKKWFDDAPETLHELRKLVVIHRYQMQLVEPLWQRFTKMWIGEAQRLRERLGQYQDLEVLQQITQPNQPLAHWHSQLDRPIAVRKRRHVIAAKRTATRLFVERPSEFRRRLIVMWEAG
jgi:CHAD domain-containing protein